MYQVWTKDEYEEKWGKEDCQTLEDARSAILLGLQKGEHPMLTEEIGYELALIIHEGEELPEPPAREAIKPGAKRAKKEVAVEAQEGTAEPDPGTGD